MTGRTPADGRHSKAFSMSDLEEILQHLENVRQTGIRYPELSHRARPTVEQLVRQAASIKLFLDGEVWDDTKDLV